MIGPVTLRELSAACGVACEDVRLFTGRVVIDSRMVQPGDLFVALRGTRTDGHAYLPAVQAAGAVAALVEQQDASCDLLQWMVPDCVAALGQLGAFNRNRFHNTLIALTGSAGKTSTKEMIATILSQHGNPLVTSGNLNNHLGVPLTLLGLSGAHDSAVIEMGASAQGEIRYLTGLARPDIALVTTVAPAHIEGFGSLEGVAKGKSEIFELLSPDGTAIVNLDNPWTASWVPALARRCRVLTFSIQPGRQSEADVYAADLTVQADGMAFTLQARGEAVPVQLHLLGEHNVGNAVAAAACCLAAGLGVQDIATGLAHARPYQGRLQSCRGIRDCTVIDDSYNANPASVEMAIRVLLGIPQARKVLVLGDMAELGPASRQLHHDIGALAARLGIRQLLACGEQSRATVEGFGEGALHYADRDALCEACVAMADAGTAFLVKGSRSAGMEQVAQALVTGQQAGTGQDCGMPAVAAQGRSEAC